MKLYLTFFLTLTFLLLSCQTTQKPGEYTGKDGIVMTLAGGIPTRIYTEQDLPIQKITGNVGIGFQDQVLGTRANHTGDIDLGVKIWNKGTSFVRGAVYLSGYDPSIIAFEGQDDNVKNLQAYRDCTLSVDRLGFGLFSGNLQCQRIDLGNTFGNVSLGLAINKQGHVAFDLAGLDLSKTLDKVLNTRFFERAQLFGKTDISYTQNDAGKRFDITFKNPDLDIAYASRGRLFLAAFSFIDFTMNGKGAEYLLPPSTADYPGTNAQYFNFRGTVRGLPAGQPTATQTILVKTCYLYSTYASPSVCIDPDPSSATKKVCTPTRYTNGKGQGAPVAITSIQQETTPTKIYFNIDIENIGGGQLYDPGSIQRCNPYYPLPVTDNDLDTVLVGAAYIGKQRLECDPPLAVRLFKNKGRVRCWYDLKDAFTSKTGYLTPFTLELWYGYSTSLSRTINIKRS